MALSDITSLRLVNQQIIGSRFDKPKDLVSWLGAVQAQDYAGSLWAIGLRLTNASQAMVETAIRNREIVRTWPMRGTLHFVAAEDVHWMLALLTPRVLSRTGSIYKSAGLDDAIFKKSRQIITNALEVTPQLTRSELYERLEKSKIATNNQRGLHILGYWAQQGLICLGPHLEKQPSFVLLDEWVSNSKKLNKEEALNELANRYFKSHGPATVQDFAWWSGLTLTDVRKGLESSKENFQAEIIDKVEYWMSKGNSFEKVSSGLHLFPSYDEYLVAYKDRSAAFDQKYLPQIVKSGNGIFSPVIVINGRVGGTWKRVIKKDKVAIESTAFSPFNKSHTSALKKTVKHYAKFLGKEVLEISNVNLS
jgi:hypothetical protein